MKPQEALHEISTMVYRNTDDCEMKISKDCYKAIVNALEKQIPKKVKMTNDLYPMGVCPCCKNEFIPHTGFEHCHYCGQALDWSDTE